MNGAEITALDGAKLTASLLLFLVLRIGLVTAFEWYFPTLHTSKGDTRLTLSADVVRIAR